MQSYGLEFRCQEALKHILAGFCTPEMDRKFDQGTFVSRKVTVAEVLLYLNILYRNMLQLQQLPLVSSLTVKNEETRILPIVFIINQKGTCTFYEIQFYQFL